MGKLFLMTVLLPLQAFALQVKDPQFVRVLDGQVVPCRERHEVGKLTYALRAAALSADDRWLSAELNLDFAGCVAKDDKLMLNPQLPLMRRERKEFRSPDLFVGDENYSELAVVPLEDKISQTANLRLELDKALTAEQRRRLGAGKQVRLRLSLVARRIAYLVENGKSIPLGRRNLGSYTFFITLAP